MKLQAQAASAVKWTGLASVLNAVSDVVRTVVLAHFLSPVDYGVMAMAAVVIGFAQMYMDLGISAAIIHRQNTTKNELSSLYWLNIAAGLIMFAAIWVCAPSAPLFFREPRVLPVLRTIAVCFLIAPVGSQFEVLLQKELAFKTLAKWEILASLSATAVAVGCAFNGFGIWTLAYSFLTTVTVKTVLLSAVGFRRFRPSLHFRHTDLKGYVGFGLFQMGERSINYLAERLDQLMIGPLLGAQMLGYYNFALNLTANPVSRINPILTKVAFPVFSKIQDDTEKLRRGYIKLLGMLVTVNAPLLVGLAAVAPWAVPAIFGAKWVPSVVLVQILCFVSLSRSIGNPIGTLQLAKGRADLGFWWNVLLFVVSLPVIYVGGKMGQATGVAIALLLLHIAINVPSYFFLVRPLIGRCATDYVRITLLPVTLATIMGAAVTFLPRLYTGMPMKVALASQVIAGAIIYVGLLQMANRKAVAELVAAVGSR